MCPCIAIAPPQILPLCVAAAADAALEWSRPVGYGEHAVAKHTNTDDGAHGPNNDGGDDSTAAIASGDTNVGEAVGNGDSRSEKRRPPSRGPSRWPGQQLRPPDLDIECISG